MARGSKRITDDEAMALAKSMPTGNEFMGLYNVGDWQACGFASKDDADLEICCKLAVLTKLNKVQIDRLYRGSALFDPGTWDETDRSGNTHGGVIINKACALSRGTSAKSYESTDSGNAVRMCEAYGNMMRYCYDYEAWYIWNGKFWDRDKGALIRQIADNVISMMRDEADRISDDDTRERYHKYIDKVESHTRKEAMIKECQHIVGIPVTPFDFDDTSVTEGYINCKNGIINLRTGELLPHKKDMMMSMICGTEYDSSHSEPTTFLKFLSDITNGNDELMHYMKVAMGYTLTGSGKEECAFFMLGNGNNGKSTFTELIRAIMGSYAKAVQPDTLMEGRQTSGREASGDVARLMGARCVTCQEPKEGARIKEGLLKQLTGTDAVTVRFMYSGEFEFNPCFGAWIAANHKPIIRGTDKGIWRRIRLIPLDVDIKNVDRNMPEKLRKEMPQILAWMVEGAMEYYEKGMPDTAAVNDATAEYKKEMDIIAGFADECMVVDYNSGATLKAADAFNVYLGWARANNEYDGMTSTKFGREFSKKFSEKVRTKDGIVYKNVSLSDHGKTFLTKTYTADQFK